MGTRHNEYQSCVALVQWWGYAHRGLGVPEFALVHVPNQAGGNPRTGMHLKKMGVRKGFPDYLLLVSRHGSNGMLLEMKSASGKLAPEQSDMADMLSRQGYHVVMCRSAMEARDAIEEYLKRAKA